LRIMSSGDWETEKEVKIKTLPIAWRGNVKQLMLSSNRNNSGLRIE